CPGQLPDPRASDETIRVGSPFPRQLNQAATVRKRRPNTPRVWITFRNEAWNRVKAKAYPPATRTRPGTTPKRSRASKLLTNTLARASGTMLQANQGSNGSAAKYDFL